MIILIATLLGLCVGALVNAFVLRTASALEFTIGRSCAVCAMPTKFSDVVPIVGYVAMRGKCRRCKAVIPRYYLYVELIMAGAFLLLGLRMTYGWGVDPAIMHNTQALGLLFIRDAIATTALVLVGAFDLLARVIPDRVTIPAMVAVFGLNIALGGSPLVVALGGLLTGAFFAIQVLISKGKWAGGGDVRMGLLMGIILGPAVGLLGLFLSYVLGAVVGLQLLLWRKANMQTRVPFGVFLALATFSCMFFGERVVQWYIQLLP